MSHGESSKPGHGHKQVQSNRISLGDDARNLGSYVDNSKPSVTHHHQQQQQQQRQNLIFGTLNRDMLQSDVSQQKDRLGNSYLNEGLNMDRTMNRFPMSSNEVNGNGRGNASISRGYEQESSNIDNRKKQIDNGSQRAVAPPPGFSSNIKNVRNREYGMRASDHNVDKGKGSSGGLYKDDRLSNQLDSRGQSVSAFDIEKSMMGLHVDDGGKGKELRSGVQDKVNRDRGQSEINDLEDDETSEKSDKKKQHDKVICLFCACLG